MAATNQVSNVVCPIVDLHRGGMTIWNSTSDASLKSNFAFPLPECSWENQTELQSWFSAAVAQSNLNSTTVDVLLPRSAVCLHLLELPRTDEHQLASMVQIQVESLYSERSDSIVFDYSPLPSPADSVSQQLVLLATVPKALLASVQQLCRQAGLSLQRASIRDLVVNRKLLKDRSNIGYTVWLGDDSQTMGICLGNQIVQTLSLPVATKFPAADVFQGCERRLLQSLPLGCRDLSVDTRLAVIAFSTSEQKSLAIEWANSLGLQTQAVSSLSELVQMESFEEEADDHQIDFCNPYRVKVVPRIRRSSLLAMAGTLLLIAGLIGYRYYVQTTSEAELASLQQRMSEAQTELDSMSRSILQFEGIEAWKKNQVHWGRELALISRQVSARNAYLYRLQLESFDDQRRPVVRMDGRAPTVTEAMDWNRQLSKLNDRYSIQPQSLDSGVSDPEYPIQFRIEAQINQTDDDSDSAATMMTRKTMNREADSNRM